MVDGRWGVLTCKSVVVECNEELEIRLEKKLRKAARESRGNDFDDEANY